MKKIIFLFCLILFIMNFNQVLGNSPIRIRDNTFERIAFRLRQRLTRLFTKEIKLCYIPVYCDEYLRKTRTDGRFIKGEIINDLLTEFFEESVIELNRVSPVKFSYQKEAKYLNQVIKYNSAIYNEFYRNYKNLEKTERWLEKIMDLCRVVARESNANIVLIVFANHNETEDKTEIILYLYDYTDDSGQGQNVREEYRFEYKWINRRGINNRRILKDELYKILIDIIEALMQN